MTFQRPNLVIIAFLHFISLLHFEPSSKLAVGVEVKKMRASFSFFYVTANTFIALANVYKSSKAQEKENGLLVLITL